MSKVAVEMIRCDRCSEPGKTYVVFTPETALEVDLCEKHARPMRELLSGARPHVRRRRSRPSGEMPLIIQQPPE